MPPSVVDSDTFTGLDTTSSNINRGVGTCRAKGKGRKRTRNGRTCWDTRSSDNHARYHTYATAIDSQGSSTRDSSVSSNVGERSRQRKRRTKSPRRGDVSTTSNIKPTDYRPSINTVRAGYRNSASAGV